MTGLRQARHDQRKPVDMTTRTRKANTRMGQIAQAGKAQLAPGKLRELLAQVLISDADLNAFCLDFFPTVHSELASGMERKQKVNILLERGDAAEILRRLRDYDNRKPEAQFESSTKKDHVVRLEHAADSPFAIDSMSAISCRLFAKELLSQASEPETTSQRTYGVRVAPNVNLRVNLNLTAAKDSSFLRALRHSVEMLDLLAERLEQIEKAKQGVLGVAINFEPERREKLQQSEEHLGILRQQMKHLIAECM